MDWMLRRDEIPPARGFAGFTRRAYAITLVLALLSTACGSTQPSREVRVASRAVNPRELTTDDVTRAVVVTRRPQDIVVRGPTMQVTDRVRLVVDGNDLGTVQQVRAGFLFGVRRYDSATAQHFLSFQSDIIEGTNRFRSVTLDDGRPLPFTIAAARADPCVPPCFLVLETLIAALPETLLRTVPDQGLPLSIGLDNGTTVRIVAPAVYVRGYLAALDTIRVE